MGYYQKKRFIPREIQKWGVFESVITEFELSEAEVNLKAAMNDDEKPRF